MKINRENRALMAIISEGLLSRLSFGLISFALPLYARSLGLSLKQIGVLVALNSAVAIGLKPAVGWAADRWGMKRTFVAAIGLRSVVSLLFGFVVAPWELYAIRSIHGCSMAMRDPSANALIAEHGGKKKVASAFAWYQTARTVASSVSKAAAGVLLAITASNFNFVFGLAFFLSLAPLVVVLLFVDEAKHHEHVEANAPARNVQQGRPSIVPYVGLGFLIASTAEMLSGMFPVLATEYAGLSKAQAGLVYGVSTVVTIIAGPVFGWLSDHVSRKLVLMVRSVANSLSSLLYIIWPTFAGIGIAKTMDDAGKAAFRPAWGALMAQISGYDKSTRARTVSWMSMGEDAGGVVAPMLAGFLWSTWGIGALMGVRIALAIGTEIYAAVVARTPKERSDDNEVSAMCEDNVPIAGVASSSALTDSPSVLRI